MLHVLGHVLTANSACGPAEAARALALGLTFNGFRVSGQPVGSWPETGFGENTQTDHKPV
jgi:hypothetical protein